MIRRVQPHDPYVLPPDLPEPEDDGAADHLPGARIPSLVLESSQGPVDLAELCAELGVLYVYPRTGKPGVESLPGWDEFPGARGCTPQSCAFRDHAQELAGLGARRRGPLGADARATRSSSPSAPTCRSRCSPTPSCARRSALGLPTFSIAGHRLYRRLALGRDGADASRRSSTRSSRPTATPATSSRTSGLRWPDGSRPRLRGARRRARVPHAARCGNGPRAAPRSYGEMTNVSDGRCVRGSSERGAVLHARARARGACRATAR